MSGKTAGQAAYEAYDQGLTEQFDVFPDDPVHVPYANLADAERTCWEAAAQAAIAAYIAANGCDPADARSIIAEAITGAGTAHLLDPGDPDGPRWRKLTGEGA